MSLEDKVAIVTGGASGIGLATARRLLDAGAKVVIADLDGDGAEAAAAESDGATAVRCDVSRSEEVEALVQAAVSTFGGLDIMINNAGVGPVGPITDITPQALQRTLAVNVAGPYYGIQHAAPRIAERGGGAILSTASTAGLRGTPLMAAYAASKAALINLTASAALELRPLGIRVNCVLPGLIDTPMLHAIKPSFEAAAPVPIAELITARQGRAGEPDDVARALVHLAGDEAEFVSGVALPVDNAMSAGLF